MLSSFNYCFPEVENMFNNTINHLRYLHQIFPGSDVIVRYIKNSYQNDPFRIVLELFLVIFAVRYLFSKKYAPDTQEIILSKTEINELIDEWIPEPLVPPTSDDVKKRIDSIPVIDGPTGPVVKLLDGKSYMNLASYDFIGSSTMERIHQSAVSALRKYGVGACGPPGFYGTIDVHIELEKALAKFIGVPEAIIYAQNFAAVSSVVPAFSKRGDVLVCDESINFALQKGVQISRSTVRYFKHNDMDDLESILKEVDTDSQKAKKLTRRFIIVEGIYQNVGDSCPLEKIIELKKKYKFRVILDESISFGSLGSRGAGLTDRPGICPKDVDIIVGSMTNALGSAGGFCAGLAEVVDHQRLSGVAYCFSAALPALLAKTALETLNELEARPDLLSRLRQNISTFKSIFKENGAWSMISSPESPIIHLRLKKFYGTRLSEEEILQSVVEAAAKKSLLITQAFYVQNQEIKCPTPSIRISLSAAHPNDKVKDAAQTLMSILQSVSVENHL